MIFTCVKRTNTKIQIHKYTNTAYDKVPDRPNMWYIFEKRIVQRYQKWYSHVSNAQIQKSNYTNTQIRHMAKCQKDPTCGIFLKRGLIRDTNYDVHMSQTRKYKNTNTQIRKYTNTVWSDLQKDATIAIFFKRKWYEDLKNNVPMSLTCKYTIKIHKYTNTNTQIQHMTKCQKAPTCGIFLKRGLFKGIKNYISIQYKLEHSSFAQLYVV